MLMLKECNNETENLKELRISHLIVILHELDDDPDVIGVVLDGYDPHDVGSVLGVGILTIFVGQNEACICFMYLNIQLRV